MMAPESTAYKVTLPQFEGPLDLLLYLIRKKEMSIFDIQIAVILDDYLHHLSMMKTMNIDVASEFLLMAATLAHIKSRLLLRHNETIDGDEDDPQAQLDQLAAQLAEYEKYKAVAGYFESMITLDSTVFKRPEMPLPEEIQSASGRLDVSMDDLVRAFNEILAGKPADQKMMLTSERFTLRQGMDHISALFASEKSIPFSRMFESVQIKSDCVMVFLSLLEMVKMGLVRIVDWVSDHTISIEATEKLVV